MKSPPVTLAKNTSFKMTLPTKNLWKKFMRKGFDHETKITSRTILGKSENFIA